MGPAGSKPQVAQKKTRAVNPAGKVQNNERTATSCCLVTALFVEAKPPGEYKTKRKLMRAFNQCWVLRGCGRDFCWDFRAVEPGKKRGAFLEKRAGILHSFAYFFVSCSSGDSCSVRKSLSQNQLGWKSPPRLKNQTEKEMKTSCQHTIGIEGAEGLEGSPQNQKMNTSKIFYRITDSLRLEKSFKTRDSQLCLMPTLSP